MTFFPEAKDYLMSRRGWDPKKDKIITILDWMEAFLAQNTLCPGMATLWLNAMNITKPAIHDLIVDGKP